MACGNSRTKINYLHTLSPSMYEALNETRQRTTAKPSQSQRRESPTILGIGPGWKEV